MGRTGTFFAFEQLGIEPDLVTLAKGLAKRAAHRGAARGRARRARLRARATTAPPSAATPSPPRPRVAVVEAIDDELLARVRERGARLAAGLRGARRACASVRGRGLLVGAVLDRPVGPVVDACREQGLLVLSAGPGRPAADAAARGRRGDEVDRGALDHRGGALHT